MPKFVGAIDVNGAYTLPTADGSANQVLKTDGSGTVSFANEAGGGGSPGGSNTHIQFNNSDSFGGSANFTFDGTSTVTLASTDAGSSAAPIIELYRNSSSAADADYLGQIKFQGENDAGGKVVYAKITAKISDASDTTEDGIIEIAHHKAGSNNISARFTSTALKLINGTGIEIADGLLTLGSTAVTATAAELNILDGVTATASELNILDGVTSTTAELNILDGVTATATELNILDGVTSTTAELNILDGVTSTASELNLLDGITAGTVSASLAVIADSNKDVTGFRNVTLTGELDAATLDISGDADIDGTTNLDAVDIDGNVQLDGTFYVGVDGSSSYDVRFYGNEAASMFFYDASDSSLMIRKQIINTNTHDTILKLVQIENTDVDMEVGAGPGIDFYIADGGSTLLGASIAAEKRSDSDTNDATGLVFKTSANGVTTPVRALTINSAGQLVIGDNTTNGPKLYEGQSDTLTVDTSDGIVEIGCMNASACHFYTDRSTIFWGADSGASIRMTDTQLSPYTDESADLGSSAYTWNKLWLGQASTFSSGGFYTLRSRDSDRQVMEYVSSERYKKDIEDLSVQEAYQILEARPIKFRGIDDDASVPLEAGLSAESMHAAGYEYAVRYDEGHWGETPRGVYYEMLTAPLIKICKDQKEKIEAMEARLAALEG